MPHKAEKQWNTRFHRHRQYNQEFHKRLHRKHRQEFHQYHKYLRLTRPLVLVFTVVIIYLLFFWVGYKAIGIILAAFITIKEIIQLFFLWRLEKRIFQPIEKLNQGVQEIARGNYNVNVETDVRNEIGLLIDSFNEMARKLRDSEKLKHDYEENRKNLIANISHDLKTPMASIQGYIEAIFDGAASSPEKLDKYLKIINHNTAYVNKLIDDLMMFSRLDMNRLDFCFEEIQFRPFMRDLM
ncbi:MAG: HAMP domain-containing sensor histidine kinase [Syntrophomonas sp.]